MAFCTNPRMFYVYACLNSNGTNCTKTMTTAYVASNETPPNCTGAVVLSNQEFIDLQKLLSGTVGNFDYVAAGAIFAFFFSFVVGVWYFSKNVGLIINAVKRF